MSDLNSRFASSFFLVGKRIALICPLMLAGTLFLQVAIAQNSDIPTLEIGKPLRSELSSAQTRSYRIVLATGDQYLHVSAKQLGIDIGLALFDQNGKKLIAINTPNNAYGTETLTVLLSSAGVYRLEVGSSDKDAPAGRYEITMVELHRPTDQNRHRVIADNAFREAEALRTEGSEQSLKSALKNYEEALSHYRQAADRTNEAFALTRMGLIHQSLNDLQKALDYHEQARPIYHELRDSEGEAWVVNNIGLVYYSKNQPKLALEYFTKAHTLFVAAGNHAGEAETMDNIGSAYYAQNETDSALDFYLKALPLRRLVRDRDGEVVTLNNIGATYRQKNQVEKTREYLDQALTLARAIGNRATEAAILFNIADLYASYGEPRKAFEYWDKSLTIRHEVGDKNGEAEALNSIGVLHLDLGEREDALTYFLRALPLRRATGDRSGEGTTLNNIGGVYDELGDKRQAIVHYEQAKDLYHAIGDADAEALALHNIGAAYYDLDEKQRAFGYYQQALPLFAPNNLRDRAMALNNIGIYYNSLKDRQKALEYFFRALPLYQAEGDRRREGRALTNIAAVYGSLRERDKALDYFRQAMPRTRAVADRSGEAKNYQLLMSFHTEIGNGSLAIFYGKEAVNLYQKLRSNIRGLDKNTQKVFLKSIEPTYRQLAELLIKQNRGSEAQEVLNAFKDQQFFDFGPSTKDQLNPIAQSVSETKLGTLFENELSKLGALDNHIAELEKKLGPQGTDLDAKSLEQLKRQFQQGSQQLLALLSRSETQFDIESKESDKAIEIKDTTELQSVLRQTSAETGQKTVAVYTVVSDSGFYAVVVSADGITPVAVPAANVNIRQKAIQLWAILQSADYDPRPLAHEIYESVFKPIETTLPKDTTTIIWSLDNALRYIPMAALYDGKRYLAERYNHVIFTRAEKERLLRVVSPIWTGYGFSSAKAHTVTIAGRAVDFGPLDFAAEEMKIFRTANFSDGIIDGEVLSEEKFTKAALLSALTFRRPLIHISSHFRFLPGDESQSFLLLGDGGFITLADLKAQLKLFDGVELLTLSACETAAQQDDAGGREIDAFAELAQRLGASSVLASLWPVLDKSTADFMKAFYVNRQNRKQTKAEALRQAQLDLIYGRTKPEQLSPAGGPTTRSTLRKTTSMEGIVVETKYRLAFKVDQKKPFAHPYYWAPFVLFGNWK